MKYGGCTGASETEVVEVVGGIALCSCPGRFGGMEADWFEVGG